MTDAISIEETNRIRAAIGLKPLPVPGGRPTGPTFKESNAAGSGGDGGDEEPGSTLESRQGAAYDNWKKLQDEAASRAARQARTDAVKKARDAAQRLAVLQGRGLGEAAADGDDADADTRTWLLRQAKRQKKIDKARRLEQELAEREQAMAAATAAGSYSAKDLAGVKVGHELDEFEAGAAQVLTLKDATIDEIEEEGDELENVELREKEKLAERLDSKKRTLTYNPNADDDDSGEKTVLSKYDEEIQGKKKKAFTLGKADGDEAEEEGHKGKAGTRDRPKAQVLNLDVAKTDLTSDYLDLSEVKIRKPKKSKKTKSTKRKAVDDDDDIFPVIEAAVEQNGDAMEVDLSAKDTINVIERRPFGESLLADDEDLQAALAVQRRNALKKRKKLGPAELARQIREEALAAPDGQAANGETADGDEDVGLVIDETSEFVSNIQKPAPPTQRRQSKAAKDGGASAIAESPTQQQQQQQQADHEGDVAMGDDDDDEAKAEAAGLAPQTDDVTSTGLDREITLEAGIGSTLTMLTQRGLLKPSNAGELNALQRERQRFLIEKQRREAEAERRARLQRERDRTSGKLERMSTREKEAYAQAENKQRDQQESRQMIEIFNREYKPDIEINYIDEFGRQMTPKEAFKHLSHQFHGKGSGKQKTEKRLKKIAEERQREAKSTLSGAADSNMGSAMGMVSKTSKTPGIRLQ